MDAFLTLTRAEFEQLKALVRRKRWDWPAVFSVNHHREIWPFATYKRTPEEEREPVRGLSRVIDEVADRYLSLRSDGGRFFVDDRHAFYKGPELGDAYNLIVIFTIV
jgi:hypothetical protein